MNETPRLRRPEGAICMSTLLCGVELTNAKCATIDLKHSLRHQAPRRAPKSTIAMTVYSLPHTQDVTTSILIVHERWQASFIVVLARPRPGGGLL